MLIGIAVALLLTWLLLIAALVIRRPKTLQLEAAYRRFSPSNALPGRNQRPRLTLLVLAVFVILNVVWLWLLLSRTSGEQAASPPPPIVRTPADCRRAAVAHQPPSLRAGSVEGQRETIQVGDVAESARPFQPVRIQGTYRGEADTLLRVQRWEEGKWLAFPVPTKTDRSGQFTAYVEFGQPGRYRLRVLDPKSGVTSKTFLLVIKG